MAHFDWKEVFQDQHGGANAKDKAKLTAAGKKRIFKRTLEVFFKHVYGAPIMGYPTRGDMKHIQPPEINFVKRLKNRVEDKRRGLGKVLASPCLLRGFGWRLKVEMKRKVGKIPKGWLRLSKS